MTQPSRTRRWAIALAISAILVVVPPLLGYLGTVVGMIRSFGKLESTGGANPQALSQDISLALNTAVAGLAVAAIALVAFVISLVGFLRAKRTA